MSTVGTIKKLATEAVGKAAHAVTHPRRTASAVTGHAKGLASTVTGGQKAAGPTDSATAAPTEAPPAGGPERHVEPAEPVPPAEPVEPSTTEPKAASRDGAHHGRGAEPTDDWHDEIEDAPDVGINPATGQPNQGQTDDGPLIDPSVAKQVRSESEIMGRAADPHKDAERDPDEQQ